MSATPSPLGLIRDKERILAKEIRAAAETARARVEQARARADAILAQAERDGAEEAERQYQEGLAQAQAQAQAIEAHGDADAAALREASSARIQTAAEFILRFILPGHEKS